MPAVLTEPPIQPSTPDLPAHKLWTRAECAVLVESGLLDPERYELIEGELISTMKTPYHLIALKQLARWLERVFGERFVNSEGAIDVAPEDNPTNEPEPDIAVLNREDISILPGHPQPGDIRLAAEVAYSNLAFALTVKANLYARAGIPEYWVLDVKGRRLIVHREPKDGRYSSIVVFSEHEAVAPLAAPQAQFPVKHAFPW